MSKPKTKDPLAILESLRAAIAPPPDVPPDGYRTTMEWGKLWSRNKNTALRLIQCGVKAGKWKKVLCRAEGGRKMPFYGPV